MKKIILVDPHVSGHHLSYIRIYSRAFVDLDHEVTILCQEAGTVGTYLAELPDKYRSRIRVCKLSRRNISAFESAHAKKQGVVSNLWKSFFSWLDFRDITRAIKRNCLDRDALVFILWLDTYISRYLPAIAVDLTLPAKFAGLYFHPAHLKPAGEVGRYERDLLFFIPLFQSKKLAFVGGFDDLMMSKLANRYRGVIFRTLPDIAEKHEPDIGNNLIQEILAKARGRNIVALTGSLDHRKNILAFFEAARDCTDDDLFFVCVGNLHRERFPEGQLEVIQSLAAEHRERIFLHDGFISSDQVFDALFVISAVIFAVYRHFPASSNMIVKAALYGVPIIVSDEHLMGELVAEYRLGTVIREIDPHTILQAIRRVIRQGKGACGFKQFNEDYSFESLKRLLSELT